MNKGILYIVATPIGNLSDITFRAIEILKTVDIIACEDTRVTQKLLNHFDIRTKTISCHKFSEQKRSGEIIDKLNNGMNVALVTDAGTPLISDPGSVLIKNVRNENIKIVPIVGACAAIALMQSVENCGRFSFIGFFPQKKEDINSLLDIIYFSDIVFYEAANRILNTLDVIKETFGDKVNISIGRELTKKFEDINSLKINDMINYLKSNPLKGEIVGIVHKKEEEKENTAINFQIKKLLSKGFSAKDVSIILSELDMGNKNDIYKLAIRISSDTVVS